MVFSVGLPQCQKALSLDSLCFGLLEGGGTENERSLAVAKADDSFMLSAMLYQA